MVLKIHVCKILTFICDGSGVCSEVREHSNFVPLFSLVYCTVKENFFLGQREPVSMSRSQGPGKCVFKHCIHLQRTD